MNNTIKVSFGKSGRPLKNDLTNKKFGKLTVLYRTRYHLKGVKWMCVCDCGNFSIPESNDLKSGHTTSCGCYGRSMLEKTTHGHTKGRKHTTEYEAWAGMIARCKNKNRKQYKDYGGRGIAVCERWKNYDNFYSDMGEKPKGMTIERIDNDKGYSPDNCKWATREEQGNNTRKNIFITHNGKTQTIAQWAREKNIYPQTLYNRICTLKWPHKRALTEPVNPTNRIY